MRHDILFVPQIPHEQKQLVAILTAARAARRKQRLMHLASVLMVLAGIAIFIIGR